MRLPRGHHLAYCTNIHPAETWPETLAALEQHALAVRQRVCPGRPFGIGLRLSDLASRQLSEGSALPHFRRWLERNDCYVFTINGFPFGRFHGERVKERVYLPDWTSPERLEYTNRLFDLLAQLLPEGVAGSVSTVPGSFKEFIAAPGQGPQDTNLHRGSMYSWAAQQRRPTLKNNVERTGQAGAIRANLHACVKHIAATAARAGRQLCLGLEPEPLCLLETTRETVDFFDRLRDEHPGDERLEEFLGVTYDTCHLAVEFEEAAGALGLLKTHRVKVCKVQLSNALKLRIADCGLRISDCGLAEFADGSYLHQVVARDTAGQLTRFRDLEDFLNPQSAIRNPQWEEARIHFHVPLHTPAGAGFDTTSDHLLGALDVLQAAPELCSHLEMETYTWEVLPAELKSRSVADQLAAEYEWVLRELRRRGLA